MNFLENDPQNCIDMNTMTRKECLDKIQEVVDNLDTLLTVIKSPSKTTVGWDCEVYEDEAKNLTNALNDLRVNYGNETRTEFSEGLNNEKKVEMKKQQVIDKAQGYSKNALIQKGYMAGFQAACNIVREKLSTCYNDDFCDEMEELSEVAWMDFGDELEAKINS